MNVLSLFDGMSCGRIALERAGIHVDNYFSSEIDKHALKGADANWPCDTENRLGDVTKIDASKLPKIGLLIGGSPCQGFSFAGNQLNFEDPRSKLFFEFVRLLKDCKPKYFMLENVVMKKEFQDVISKELGVEPILINSALVSAQNRKRLYWTNIGYIEQPKDAFLFLKDILEDDVFIINKPVYEKHLINKNGYSSRSMKQIIKNSKTSFEKAISICTNSNTTGSGVNVITDGVNWRKLTPIECERLQTIPDNYTNHVSNTHRYKMIGNGWTVDVIAHILKGIQNPNV